MPGSCDEDPLGDRGRVEIYDRGVDGPDRFTIVFPDLVQRSASPACELIEVLTAAHLGDEAVDEPSWTVVADGEPLGERVPMDQLPEAVQWRVRDVLDRKSS